MNGPIKQKSITSSASWRGKGASLEKDLASVGGSGFGSIGVRSTVAPVCTSAIKESHTFNKLVCKVPGLVLLFESRDHLDILHVVESLLFVAGRLGSQCKTLRSISENELVTMQIIKL